MCTLSRVEQVGIRQLRASLAQAVRRAAAGERVVVSVAGRAVAQLGPLDPGGDQPTLADLAARGLLVPARRADRPGPAARIPLWAGARLDKVLAEVR
jgi:prevent-host-death family protein